MMAIVPSPPMTAASEPSKNFIARWFTAAGASGDDMRIRFGSVSDTGAITWHFLSHDEHDGIGGFARLLREHGAKVPTLPTSPHHSTGLIKACWQYWRTHRRQSRDWQAAGLRCGVRSDWNPQTISGDSAASADQAVAWHVLTANETNQVLTQARNHQVSVNSWLLTHLDRAIRPQLCDPNIVVPWMIPVNLRGILQFRDDTENNVSSVTAFINAGASASDIQLAVRQPINRGEHHVHAFILRLGCLLSHNKKVAWLERDRKQPSGTIAAFSNLGHWPLPPTDHRAGWLFCPPVAPGQLLSAGCVTLGERMGLCLQGDPRSPHLQAVVPHWLDTWRQAALHNKDHDDRAV